MRHTLERFPNGKLANGVEGINEFAHRVAKELMETYSEIDFTDLLYAFDASFRYAMSYELMKESAEYDKKQMDNQ